MVNDTLGLLLDKLVVTSGGGEGLTSVPCFPLRRFVTFWTVGDGDVKLGYCFSFLFPIQDRGSRLEANFESFAENSTMSIGIFISNLS